MKYISLLRGINVSGKKIIKMEDLKLLFESLNYKNVKTYIQSGNLVFDCNNTDKLTIKHEIEQSIRNKYTFEVPVFIIDTDKLKKVHEQNPFLKDRMEDLEKLHVTFLEKKPDPEYLKKLSIPQNISDEFIINEDVIYISCPNVYGKTKFTNTFFENKLKTSASTRNWKTIEKLMDLSK